MSNFQRLEQYLDYNFQNRDFLIRALTHQSTNSDTTANANHLEFIGSGCLYLAILQHSILRAPATLRAGQLIGLVDQITSTSKKLNQLFLELEIEDLWLIEKYLAKRTEERIWAISAIAGALFLDGGYSAVLDLALKILDLSEQEVLQKDDRDPGLPGQQWPNKQTIRLELIDATFPRCISAKTFRLMPWALETHIKPGISNNRCYQLFELGDAALRCFVDLELYQNNLLEPIENRFLHRERKLKFLGLESRRDQVYASCFSSQDWRRQSLDYRTQSLKNILGAVLISEGEQQARSFAKLILSKAAVMKSSRNISSIVVSHSL